MGIRDNIEHVRKGARDRLVQEELEAKNGLDDRISTDDGWRAWLRSAAEHPELGPLGAYCLSIFKSAHPGIKTRTLLIRDEALALGAAVVRQDLRIDVVEPVPQHPAMKRLQGYYPIAALEIPKGRFSESDHLVDPDRPETLEALSLAIGDLSEDDLSPLVEWLVSSRFGIEPRGCPEPVRDIGALRADMATARTLCERIDGKWPDGQRRPDGGRNSGRSLLERQDRVMRERAARNRDLPPQVGAASKGAEGPEGNLDGKALFTPTGKADLASLKSDLDKLEKNLRKKKGGKNAFGRR